MKLLDTSCLSCLLKEIERPEILTLWEKRGYSLVITLEVYEEIKKDIITLDRVDSLIKDGKIEIITVCPDMLEKFRLKHLNLGKGECSIICASELFNKKNQRYYAVLDDKIARRVAKKYKVTLTGTYGLLKILLEREEISKEEYDECKDLLRSSSFRINFDKIK